MGIRKILTEPNKILRQKSNNVEKIDRELQQLMDDMLDTMYSASGIGLAAIQIGIPKRVIVLDITRDNKNKNPMYFVNPEIAWKETENATYEEGCLSVPNQFAEIDRPKSCHIKFLDYFGESKFLKTQGLLATCIQHEIDHLEGILFIDYLSKLKKSMIVKKLSKTKKESIDRIVV
jgi:peptide deformylase|tara:strand:- start:881 stop:1408 length:528 start_codon:yes stop_codon:yes gene_type:complete